MATITPSLPSVVFQSELSRIVIDAGGDDPLDIEVTANGTTVLLNTYYPNSAHKVTIYDLDRLLEPSFAAGSMNVWLAIKAGAQTLTTNGESSQIMVVRCSQAVSETAEAFAPDFFLTTMMYERDTVEGRFECLTYLASIDGHQPVKVLAKYVALDGSLATKEFSLDTDSESVFCTVEVSPNRFADEVTGKLVWYRVSCGKRKMDYRVRKSMPEADPMLVFANCFGAWEPVYLTGTKAQQPKYERSMVEADGSLLLYDIDETMSYKSHSGKLRNGMTAVMHDLARSKSVWMINKEGARLRPIVVTDCEMDTDNTDELQEVTLTWRLAGRQSAMLSALRPPRLFDKYFDKTFQ